MPHLNTTPIKLNLSTIEQAIRSSPTWDGTPEAPVLGDMAEAADGFGGGSFRQEVAAVWETLVNGPLAATHHIELVWKEDIEFHSTSMAGLEVALPIAGRVKQEWIELGELTDDRDATGLNALIEIACLLIDHANNSLDVASPLIDIQIAAGRHEQPL